MTYSLGADRFYYTGVNNYKVRSSGPKRSALSQRMGAPYLDPLRYSTPMAGLGQASVNGPNRRISVGTAARRDPILAFSSVWASEIVRMATRKRSAGKRLGWIRDELNKTQVGLGGRFVSEYKKLQRAGRASDQALFDALRLVLANQVASGMEKVAKSRPVSGLGSLGDSASDISAVFCGVIGVGTLGGAIGTSFDNPTGSVAVGQAGASALQAAGCNSSALAEQARIAEANAATAQANAAAAAAAGQEDDNKTMTYVAIGGGVLALALVGVIALRK